MSLPVIGIPCSNEKSASQSKSPILTVQTSYVEAISRAGGAPLLIPLGLCPDAMGQIMAHLDGLLLAGGVDIHPRQYGAERHRSVKHIDELRDDAELWMTRQALEMNLPLLAICRGLQVLNVAAGGTLYQDLASEYAGSIKHDRYTPTYPRDEFAHSVRLATGSRLYAIMGAAGVMTNSRHHQAARDIGNGLMPTAWAPDGVVEGLESRERRFVVAVQWHPENMIVASPAMSRLFDAFVVAAGT